MKHKVESWEERRKKAIVRGYNKERSGDKTTFDVSKIYDEEERRMEEDDGNKRCKVFKKPHEQFLEKKEEKRRKREEFLKAKAEKEKAMENCKKRKVEKYKKLNRKTRRGQPIMKERMEYLLEKIQKSIDA
ncbi:hypothetical protein BDFB_010348 [Asbolus verrucosus]|uniref:Uncharacterized protein n=1 Tax=Asbolus verrucosus TaxID=1661398 RepID=A0A482WA23_ASBVE|nr:hypothetical protein BDFB_010348 [Asbolus verrucosus]